MDTNHGLLTSVMIYPTHALTGSNGKPKTNGKPSSLC
jgi:hypothetical protein